MLHVRPVGANGAQIRPWFLVTDLSVTCAEEADHVLDAYLAREVATDNHQALRTGLLTRQEEGESNYNGEYFTSASLTALMLVDIQRQCRLSSMADVPASHFLAKQCVQALAMWARRSPDLTLHDFLQTLAKLGGSKSDSRAGWYFLWNGWQLLRLMTDGPSDQPPISETPELLHCQHEMKLPPLRESL